MMMMTFSCALIIIAAFALWDDKSEPFKWNFMRTCGSSLMVTTFVEDLLMEPERSVLKE